MQMHRRCSALIFGWLGCPLASVAEEENEIERLSPKVKVLVWTEFPYAQGKSCPHAHSAGSLEDLLYYRTLWFLMYKEWEGVLKFMYLKMEESEYLFL